MKIRSQEEVERAIQENAIKRMVTESLSLSDRSKMEEFLNSLQSINSPSKKGSPGIGGKKNARRTEFDEERASSLMKQYLKESLAGKKEDSSK